MSRKIISIAVLCGLSSMSAQAEFFTEDEFKPGVYLDVANLAAATDVKKSNTVDNPANWVNLTDSIVAGCSGVNGASCSFGNALASADLSNSILRAKALSLADTDRSTATTMVLALVTVSGPALASCADCLGEFSRKVSKQPHKEAVT